jgi:hypothetical protein
MPHWTQQACGSVTRASLLASRGPIKGIQLREGFARGRLLPRLAIFYFARSVFLFWI